MASENSLVAVERPWLFKPGQSGNPGGRPAGLAALVKQETRDGAELVEFYLRILRGKRQPLRYRLEAASWLADRGFGKAVQQVEVGNIEGEEVVFRIVDSRKPADADAQRLP